MSSTEYLSGNGLIAYPFKDGRAINPSLHIANDIFLDALFVIPEGSAITRPFISKLTVIQNTIGLEISDVLQGIMGTVSIPFTDAVNHLGNTESSFFHYVGNGWVVKFIFGPGIENIKVLGINVNFTPEQTEFSQAAVINNVPVVNALNFESYIDGSYIPSSVHIYSSGEDALMSRGTNTDFNFLLPETMYLDVKRGNGTGLHNPCDDGVITDIYTINNINPDSAGNMFILPDDCYSLKLLTYNETQLYSYIPAVEANYGDFTTPIPTSNGVAAHTGHFNAIAGSMGGHGLVIQNNCQPRCPPQNLNAFAEYLNRITDAAAELYKVVNNDYETYGTGSISGSTFTVAAGAFCGGGLPANWVDGVCNNRFIKYFHEGRTIAIQYSSNTTHTYTILEVINDNTVLLASVPPATTNHYLPFKVSDFGVKNKLNEIIIANNEKLTTKNIPSININYSTVEAYNASQQYGTFITAVIIIYNPAIDPLHFTINWLTGGQATTIPSSIKVKTSAGSINYGGNQGVINCKDYSTFEAIFFIPCSQDAANPNEGTVTFHVVDSTSGLDIENSPKVISAASASCVSATTGVTYVTATEGTPFSYTITDSKAVSYYFSGDIPSWLSTDPSPTPANGNLHGIPQGDTSHSYTITVSVSEDGGGAATQIITIDYIAKPKILNPADNFLFQIYPPDTTNRTYTLGAPLLPITATNSPTSYSFTGIPPGMQESGNGLVGQITLGSSPSYPISYDLTATASNEAGSSDPISITLELINTPITTGNAYQNTPFCYSIITGPEVLSQSLATTLPSWLSFDPTINPSGGTNLVCNFYGNNTSYTPTVYTIVIRQNLKGGTYRLLQFLIPYVSISSITYPQSGANIAVYPPDFGNTSGSNTLFTANHPLLKVLATNNPTSFTAIGLPRGLTIDNSGNIVGRINDTPGVFSITVTATNSIGTSDAVSFNMGLYTQVPVISAYEGVGLCYKFSALANATSFYITGNVPTWLNVASTVSSSCHISANRLTAPTSQDYNINVVAVINGANLSQNYILRYIGLPVISYPTANQVININSQNYGSIVYTSDSPLLKVLVSNSPTSYIATGLPQGLTIDSSGNIVGTIAGAPGSYQVTITAVNDAGSAVAKISIVISSVTIVTNAFKNQPYCYKFNSFGAATDYTYTGTVPSWLTFDWSPGAACNLNGTPTDTVSAKYTFTITGQTANGSVSTNFEIDYLVIPTITYPVAGTVYKITPPDFNARIFTTANPLFEVTADNNPTSYTATGFSNNTLQIDTSSGAIIGVSGSATTTNNIPITLTAKNAAGTSAPVVVYLAISSSPTTININANSGPVCYLFDTTDNPTGLTITGLPSWLSLNYPAVNNCNLAGTIPAGTTTTLSYNLALTRAYGVGSLHQTVILNTVHRPVITSPYSGNDSTQQNMYTVYPPDFNHRVYSASSPLLTLSATNSPTTYNATGLPSGLTIDSQGRVVGGSVTSAGDYIVSFTATNAAGTSDPAVCIIEAKSTSQVVEIDQGKVFCNAITTKDGATRYTLTGSLPSGITFNGNPGISCNFSGIASSSNAAGTYPIDITSTYPGGSSTAEIDFNLVAPPTITTTTSSFRFLPSQYTTGSPYTDTNPLVHLAYTNNPTSFSATGLPQGLEITCLGNIVGTLTAASAGKYNVTVQAINNAGASPAYKFVLDLSKITPTIRWTTPAAIPYGTALSSTQLNATAVDGTGATIQGTFAYSPSTGTVLNAGYNNTLTVVFTPNNTLDIATATAGVTLAVNKFTPVITWNSPTAIDYGTALSSTQLNATATDLNGNPVPGTFSYSPQSGTVLGGGTQTLSVNFYPTDNLNFNNATGTTSLVVNPAHVFISWQNPADIVYGAKLSSTQLNAQAYINSGSTVANVSGTYVYNPPLNTVLTGGNQTLSVTFTPISSPNYIQTPVTATVSINVTKATPIITWLSPAAIDYGTLLSSTQLNAAAKDQYNNVIDGTFVYSPAAGTKFNAGAQTLSVTFTPTLTADYNSATATTQLTINKATPQINWSNPTPINYGTALSSTQLNATVSPDAGGTTINGTLTYTPALGVVLNGGAQQLSATFVPNDTANYITSRVNVSIQVNVVTPTINWTPMANIDYGTALSNTELSAVAVPNPTIPNLAQAPGVITYSIPSGAITLGSVLDAGSYTVTATYTPSNPANFSSTTETNTLMINKVTPVLTWKLPPTNIPYLTQLRTTDLNTSARTSKGSVIQGTFSYSANSTTLTLADPGSPASGSNPAVPPSLGTVLPAGSYSVSAAFTPQNTNNYNTPTPLTSSMVVNKCEVYINWDSNAKANYYQTGVTYSCLYQGPPANEFSPYVIGTDIVGGVLSNQAHLTVAGTVIPDPLTPVKISVTPLDSLGNPQNVYGGASFSPTDTANYSTIQYGSDSKRLGITKFSNIITWATPAPVSSGTTLSAAQLNATFHDCGGTDIQSLGTVVYNPPAGTRLTNTTAVYVTFTPTPGTAADRGFSIVTKTVDVKVQ